MLAESKVAYPPIDEARLKEKFEILLRQPQQFLVAIAYSADKQPAGFIVAYVTDYLWSLDKAALHDIFFVAPEFRGTSAAMKLVAYFVAWAKAQKVKKVRIAVHTGIGASKTGRFYLKLGFKYIGGNFDMDLDA